MPASHTPKELHAHMPTETNQICLHASYPSGQQQILCALKAQATGRAQPITRFGQGHGAEAAVPHDVAGEAAGPKQPANMLVDHDSMAEGKSETLT